MGTYANETTVPVEKSRMEVERTLTRYGATSFAYGWEGSKVVVQFTANERMVRFTLALPDKDLNEFRLDGRGNVRTPEKCEAAWEQACRQKWRALALVIKAKLEAVDAGISIFEDECLAHIVIPGGSTVAEWLQPQIDEAYRTGTMPSVLQLGAGS